MDNLTFEVPINDTSFGQLSILLLKELYKRGIEPNLFPIGKPEISFEELDKDFQEWLNRCMLQSVANYHIGDPVFRLWHLNGSVIAPPNRSLMTFHELDALTPEEQNTINNQKMIVTSQYTNEVFGGNHNVVNLGFDPSFQEIDMTDKKEGKIHFVLAGKWEKRKAHAQVIRAWCKEFGDNPDYVLDVVCHNSFMHPQHLEAEFQKAIHDVPNGNVNPLHRARIKSNVAYSQVLNIADVIIGMSGGEGWDLPVYHAMGLGAHAVTLNAHAYKEYCTEKNSCLVEPSDKEEMIDNIFFFKGHPYNQGNIFTWEDEDFVAACHKALERVKKGKNKVGMKLQDRTYEHVINDILKVL